MSKGESLLYKAARDTMVEFFQKTSLNGFRLLYYIRRRKYQRLFWFCFILLGITFATYVVLVTLLNFLQDPTVTSLDNQHHAVWEIEIPFPAVAICSVNKISRQKVGTVAQELFKSSGQVNSYKFWLERMQLFTGYFDSDSVNFGEAIKFQNELDIIKSDTTINILEKIVPSCSELLILCRWANQPKACSEIFKLYATPVGYCCIFNYKRGAAERNSFTPFMPNATGIEMGLTILLNTSTADHFYADRSVSGYTLQLFDHNNFPDASTGGAQELFISSGELIELQLEIVTQTAAKEVRDYSAQRRRCYFADERPEDYKLAYSQEECLTRCRIRSIFNLCGCIPFYTPKNFIPANSSVLYCSFMHMECMTRYEVTWNTLRPADDVSKHLLLDLQESLECVNCLPLCTYNLYYYRKHGMKLKDMQHLVKNKKLFANSTAMTSEQQSLIKLYLKTEYAVQYHKNVLYNWYQILSNIGGVIGICMGCSLISGFELIYFVGFRFFEKFSRYRRIKRAT